MTASRSERAGHPVWCVRDQQSVIGRHVSTEVRVGQRRPGYLQDRGQVTVYLVEANGGPTRLVVNAAHMAGITVDLSLEDAVMLRDGLSGLLRAAGRE